MAGLEAHGLMVWLDGFARSALPAWQRLSLKRTITSALMATSWSSHMWDRVWRIQGGGWNCRFWPGCGAF